MGNSQPLISVYDRPMWEGFKSGEVLVQECTSCGTHRYPPAPVCQECLCKDHTWQDVSGATASIISWVRFHRQYLDDFPTPFEVVAVQLESGPIIVTNLIGPKPEGEWVGRSVTLSTHQHAGRYQHCARLQS